MFMRSALLSLLIFNSVGANATVLNFTSASTDNLSIYGDSVTGPGTLGYEEGFGYTPNVTLDFLPASGFGQYSVYSLGYASLQYALGHTSYDVPGKIAFTPNGGASVILHGFELATWVSGTYQTQIRIWDDNGTFDAPNLFDFDQSLASQTIYQPVTQTLIAAGVLHLYISNLGSTGIDNLSFSQTAVPVPAAAWLLASGLVGLASLRKRKA